jgi:hypothetical protein
MKSRWSVKYKRSITTNKVLAWFISSTFSFSLINYNRGIGRFNI